MSRRNRYRGVAPATLETPERGADVLKAPEDGAPLDEREDGGGNPESARSHPIEDYQNLPGYVPYTGSDETRAELGVRSERAVRLAAARALKPETTHWASMWMAGRDAALGALEAGTPIAAVYALAPPDAAGCRDCWMRGRDAALRVIQGV